MSVLAVDIGATASKPLLQADANPPRSTLEEIPTRGELGPRTVLQTIVSHWSGILARNGKRWPHVEAVGVAIPAPIERGIVLRKSNLVHNEWTGFDLTSGIQEALRTEIGSSDLPRVVVLNDAQAGLLGAARCQAYDDGSDFLQGVGLGLFVGSGIGGAWMVNGVLQSGHSGGGSEPGQSSVTVDEMGFFTGQREYLQEGRLEDWVSLLALQRQIPRLLDSGSIPLHHRLLLAGEPNESNESLNRRRAAGMLRFAVQAIDRGEEKDIAVRFFEFQAKVLGEYLTTLVMFMRPRWIFMGGAVTEPTKTSQKFRDWFVKRVQSYMDKRNNVPKQRGTTFIVAPRLGDLSAAYGVSIAALEGVSV